MSEIDLPAALAALERTPIAWDAGEWTCAPEAVREQGSDLLVTAREGSDAWLRTAYGFSHDSAHALLAPLPDGAAFEVQLLADFAGTFDQAGVFVSAGAESWVKAGLEFSDGALGLGAVVTHGRSDWSTAPVPEWTGRVVTIRVSRANGALAVRARADGGPFRLVRLAPLNEAGPVSAGPFCAAPTRAGLTVRFTSWAATAADPAIH